jgi:putative flippase GtrA
MLIRRMGTVLNEAAKYAAASAIALVADTGLLLGLTRYGGWHYLPASAVSFMAGAVIAYLLSVRFVFHAHRLSSRGLEFSGFVVIGLVGVAVNMLVLFVTHGKLGMDLVLGKGIASGCTFLINFALRRQLLFRPRALPA